MNIEFVPNLQLWKIGKQPGMTHAGMSRKNRMGTFAAHGQAGLWQMSHTFVQHRRADSVIHRQGYIDFGNLNVRHYAVPVPPEQGVVVRGVSIVRGLERVGQGHPFA